MSSSEVEKGERAKMERSGKSTQRKGKGGPGAARGPAAQNGALVMDPISRLLKVFRVESHQGYRAKNRRQPGCSGLE